MAPWGPSLGKDPQERALLRFHEEAVSGRVLVTLTEMEKAASAGLLPIGGQRRDEVCILWKGLSKHPGPCAKPLFLPRALEVLSGHAGLLGMGNLFASSDCLGAVAAQSVPGRARGSRGRPSFSCQGSVPLGMLISGPPFPALGVLRHEMRCGLLASPESPSLSPFRPACPLHRFDRQRRLTVRAVRPTHQLSEH